MPHCHSGLTFASQPTRNNPLTDLRDQLQATLGDAYTIERELGGGGMSRVFVAHERSLGRKVVIKVLPAEMAAQVSLERFKREIVLAASLQHPHIVPLHSAGESDGLPYFTMPYVEGESLRVRLARHGELPVSEAIRILREIASALSHAHEHGVVHRDIKPDNVLLSGGSAMVTDFGVAKALSASSNAEHGGMTSLGVALGTPAYMAPEQATADPAIDHRADIYAFGVLAYELLTGQPPFSGRTPQNLLAAHVTEAPEPITRRRTLPPALAALVMRCLEKRPADRPQTVGEILRALDDITTPSGGTQPTAALLATAATTSATPATAPRARILLIAAALIGVVAVTLWMTLGKSHPAGGANSAAMKTLAVLPFTNGGDTASDYFSEGISDELRGELGRMKGLTVKARSVATQFKAPDDQSAIATKLGIGLLVVGSVRTSGEQVRVTAELVRVSDNASLWSAKYDRDRKTIIGLQDSIAHQIAGALQLRLADNHSSAAPTTGTTNPRAYDLYLRGKFIFDKRGEQPIRAAISYFQQAFAADPNFARAHAALSDALITLSSWSNVASDSVVLPALAEAEIAISLDSTLADGFRARAGALFTMLRWREAESAYRRAIQLDGHDGQAHQWLGELLGFAGRLDEATRESRLATELDAFVPVRWWSLGRLQTANRRSAEAMVSFRHSLELDPSFFASRLGLAVELVQAGRTADALSELQLVPDSWGTAFYRGQRAFVLARAGRRAEAEAIVRSLEREVDSSPTFASSVGMAYLGSGDLDKAMTWLLRGVERKDVGNFYFDSPILDPLRSHPRWLELLRGAKLADQPVATPIANRKQ